MFDRMLREELAMLPPFHTGLWWSYNIVYDEGSINKEDESDYL